MPPVGRLRSAGITLLPRYYTPIRHPLACGPLPGAASYRTALAPAISRRDEEGFSSCCACPGHRAVATPRRSGTAVSISVRLPMRPSPSGCGLGLRGHLCVHFRYGPMTHTLPMGGFVDRLQDFGFPPPCYPSYGVADSFPGRTDSC
jgi:hypothetical protein